MKLSNDRLRVIKAEPIHRVHLYRWLNSGEYDDFFGNCGLLTLEECGILLKDAYMIVDAKNPDSVFGIIKLSSINDRDRNMYLGILIDNEVQGKKIGRDSLVLMVDYVLNCMNFYKIYFQVEVNNAAAEALHRCIGAVQEGSNPKKNHVYLNGKYHSIKEYAVFKGTFNKLKHAEESAKSDGK